MKKRKGPGPGPRSSPSAQKRSKERQIILLDQAPLRAKAAKDCTREMAKLEKAKADWKRYQSEDQAAFARWMASTFGAVLSRLREIETALHERELLVHEVEDEMFFSGARSYRAAYARVQNRKNNPPPPEPEPRWGPPPPDAERPPGWDDRKPHDAPDDDRGPNEFELETLFEEFLRSFMGLNPDRMSDHQYNKMFADFKASLLGTGGPKAKASAPERPRPAEPPKPEQSRLKELYRILVRRLHPDTRAEGDVEVAAIWHEVQEAYRDGHVERLETLLALTDLQENATGEHTTLAQMRAVLTELRRSYQALQRNLRAAKDNPAWNFSQTKDHSVLERRVGGDLRRNLATFERRLAALDAEIAGWAASPKTGKMKASKAAKIPPPPRAADQMGFQF